MKYYFCALFALALAPTILAEGQKPSLWERIIDNVGHGVRPSPHIGNGYPATPHAYPHQAALYSTFPAGNQAFGGGSLISAQWVLTAAHCVNNAKEVLVVLGAHDLTNRLATVQYIKSTQYFVEPEFATKDHDIALIKLETEAQLNQFVQPIRLPSLAMKNRDFVGTPAEIIGWGRHSDIDTGSSAILRHGHTRVMESEACRKAGYGDGVTNFRLCSDGSNDKGVCGGDSGGPMFFTEEDGKRTIIGIAAFRLGPDCANNKPCVFTRVTPWLEWISKLSGIPLRM